MSLEMPERTGAAPSKRERIREILEEVRTVAPARTAEEAHAMLKSAFLSVESRYAVHPDIDSPMQVNQLADMTPFDYEGRTVRAEHYEADVLLIGENGALEIRSTRAKDEAHKREHPFAEYPLLFEKPGADGRGLWDKRES